jgi:hypothetical protein
MLLLLAATLASPSAEANDHRGRLGLGFHAGLGSVSALSVRYALPTASPKVNAQIEVDAGLDTAATNGSDTGLSMVAGGRVIYGVVAEDHLSLFVAGGGAYVADPGAYVIRIQPAMGAEFFLFGLENLGFGVEWGFNIDVGPAFRLATIGGAPAVTVHYWF